MGGRITVFGALLLFLLTGTLFAQSTPQTVGACANNQFNVVQLAPWYCSGINQFVYDQWQRWLPVAFAVITVAFSIAALIFMAGVALKNQRVREFGIGEIYEATASAIIIALFMSIAAVMLGVIPASFIGPTDPYVTALNYISTTVGQTNALITSMYGTYFTAAYYASFKLNVFVGTVPQGQTPQISQATAQGIKKFVSGPLNNIILPVFGGAIEQAFLLPAQVISYLLMDGLIALHTEYYLLLFGMYAAIPVFLIPGIIFRAFVPTRSLGGMFMGIAITFFFIMPVMFSIAYFFTQQSVGSSLTLATQQINQYGQGVGSQQNALSPSSPLASTLNGLQSSMGAFWLSVLFYPAMIMALSYFAIITIADFIGGFAHGSGKFISRL